MEITSTASRWKWGWPLLLAHTRGPVFAREPQVLEQVIAFLMTGDTQKSASNAS